MNKINKICNAYLDDQIKCIDEIKKNSIDVIEEIANILIHARDTSKKIFLMGNGGSASTASHFTSDLLKTSLTKDTKKFRAISITDNIPVILAWANDTSYDDVFVSQLQNFLEKDDVVIGISGSGNSTNVLKAIKFANDMNCHTISLTGQGGGNLVKICKVNLIIPSNDMLSIETMHLLICHLLTTIIRSKGKPVFSY